MFLFILISKTINMLKIAKAHRGYKFYVQSCLKTTFNQAENLRIH